MGKLTIPESLRRTLPDRYDAEPDKVTETRTDHEWTVTYSYPGLKHMAYAILKSRNDANYF